MSRPPPPQMDLVAARHPQRLHLSTACHAPSCLREEVSPRAARGSLPQIPNPRHRPDATLGECCGGREINVKAYSPLRRSLDRHSDCTPTHKTRRMLPGLHAFIGLGTTTIGLLDKVSTEFTQVRLERPVLGQLPFRTLNMLLLPATACLLVCVQVSLFNSFRKDRGANSRFWSSSVRI